MSPPLKPIWTQKNETATGVRQRMETLMGWAIRLVQDSAANPLKKPAFEFLMLTAFRSGEVRQANWEEILWHKRTWGIPAIKRKLPGYTGSLYLTGHGNPDFC